MMVADAGGSSSRHSDEWWRQACADADRLTVPPLVGTPHQYQLGDGYLDVRSADAHLRDRLDLLFRECAVEQIPEDGLPRVRCTVHVPPGEGWALIEFADPEPLDLVAFALQMMSDRGYQETLSTVPGWRMITMPSHGRAETVAVSGQRAIVDRESPWQALVGSLAMNRLLRLQRGLVFLHAASVGIHGRGVLFIGPKGAGKTTLSLALAARGHDFLGDEIAGVRVQSLELVPIRRSLAIRDGPRAEAVSLALDRHAAVYEPFPDGTRRRRAHAAQLFPGTTVASLPLARVVFLRGFAPGARLEMIQPGREHLSLLTPLSATLWGAPPFSRARDLLRIITQVRCALLHAGPPDATADLLIHSMED